MGHRSKNSLGEPPIGSERSNHLLFEPEIDHRRCRSLWFSAIAVMLGIARFLCEEVPVTGLLYRGGVKLCNFNNWGAKAESIANNIWQNLKTGSSVSGAAWGKVNLTAKAISGGGFEHLYKQSFTTQPGEKLKKTFACYLSTSTGPVSGTLYLSNIHAAFCSDRPLSFTAPSGQESWSYYKVMLPLGKIGTINPVNMREDPKEKYLQIVTIDGHDFWFMGFVNYDKASRHLSESLSNFVAPGVAFQA